MNRKKIEQAEVKENKAHSTLSRNAKIDPGEENYPERVEHTTMQVPHAPRSPNKPRRRQGDDRWDEKIANK